MACTADDITLLFRSDYKRLCRAAEHYLRDRDLAEHAVQEAFLRLHRNRDRVDSGTASAYVWQIVVNEAKDTGQRRSKEDGLVDAATRQGLLPAEHAHAPAHDHPDRVADRAHLRALVAALPERQRAVVVLHYLCDMPDEEISKVLNTKPVTVRSQLHRARRALRAKWARGPRDA